MKVYAVVCPQIVSDGFALLGGFDDAMVVAFDRLPAAQEAATNYARLYPGETFWVVEGEPTAAYRVERAPVAVIDMVTS